MQLISIIESLCTNCYVRSYSQHTIETSTLPVCIFFCLIVVANVCQIQLNLLHHECTNKNSLNDKAQKVKFFCDYTKLAIKAGKSGIPSKHGNPPAIS